jgi:hypothetical protein
LLQLLCGNAGKLDAFALLLCLGPGKQDGVVCKQVIQQVHVRTEGRIDLLITSDEQLNAGGAALIPPRE